MMHSRFGKPRHSRRTTKAGATLFNLCLLNVSLATINSHYHNVINEVLGDIFILKCDESKASRLSGVYILEDAGIYDFPVLLKMLFQFLHSKLEVEASDENLALGVFEGHFYVFITSVFGLHYGIGIGFGNWSDASHPTWRPKTWHASHHGRRWLEAAHGSSRHLALVVIR